ncbi:unnamed protein product, partial [Prorocentrum cordatum]
RAAHAGNADGSGRRGRSSSARPRGAVAPGRGRRQARRRAQGGEDVEVGTEAGVRHDDAPDPPQLPAAARGHGHALRRVPRPREPSHHLAHGGANLHVQRAGERQERSRVRPATDLGLRRSVGVAEGTATRYSHAGGVPDQGAPRQAQERVRRVQQLDGEEEVRADLVLQGGEGVPAGHEEGNVCVQGPPLPPDDDGGLRGVAGLAAETRPRGIVFWDGTVSKAPDDGKHGDFEITREAGNTSWLPLLAAGADRAVFRARPAAGPAGVVRPGPVSLPSRLRLV